MEKQIIKAKSKQIEVEDRDQPFKDDKLGRKEYAEILTNIVATFVGGAVIALNGAWGTGKTTFLKMWEQHLRNQDFPVIHYNAWEDDICDEPLMSMLRGMKVLQKEEGLDNVFKTGAKVCVWALMGALTAATGFFGEIAKGAVEGGTKQLEDTIFDSLKKEDERAEIMHSFKESLTEYMKLVCDKGKPLVFMVDELDRCNPSFAVKVLERIKHLFDVPNIVFVLSIDKKQLSCSVKGFYGSNEIDADEYLRRFIDYDYYLPEPNAEQFCDYLYDYYGFDDFLKSELRIGVEYYSPDSDKANADRMDLLDMAKTLAQYKHLSLRQLERIFATARIGLCGMPIKSEVLPQLLFFLSYLKVCEPILFDQIAEFAFDLQEFVVAMEQLLTPEKLSPDAQERLMFNWLMAVALQCYFDGYRAFMLTTRKQVVNLYEDNKLTVRFDVFDKESISKGLVSCYINRKGYDIRHITQRLKLLEKLVGLPQP